MLLHIIFIQYLSIVSANFGLFNSLIKSFSLKDNDELELQRKPRQVKKKDFEETSFTCDELSQTSRTPFVVILLYKTSGRFLGMGSIIDKRTVLTASQVVESTMGKPFRLLVLAGRLSPWWGKDSQVQPASEIYQVEPGIALVTLKNELKFNKNILPIKIPTKVAPDFDTAYEKAFAVFGLQRTGWDIPGEPVSKGSAYMMKVETAPKAVATCLNVYPDYDFNETTMTCTHANGSWSWGCLGSPTVALNKKDQLLQVAIVVKTTLSDKENFHFHFRIAFYEQWIRAHSLLGYKTK